MDQGYKRCKICAVHRHRGQQCCYCRGWVCSRCQIEQNTVNGIDVTCSICSVIAVDSDDSPAVVIVSDDESQPGWAVADIEACSGDATHEGSGRAGSSTDLAPGVSSTDVSTGRHKRRRWKRGVLRPLDPVGPEPPVESRKLRWKSGALKLEKVAKCCQESCPIHLLHFISTLAAVRNRSTGLYGSRSGAGGTPTRRLHRTC
eukprot:1442049-Amphidinium_carterae.1